MKLSKLRAHRRHQHLSFFQWFKTTYPTQQVACRHGNLRVMGPFGIHYSKESGANLAIADSLVYSKTSHGFPDSWTLAAPDSWHPTRILKWHELELRFAAWRHYRQHLKDGDLRSKAILAAILSFPIPDKP